MDCWRWRLSVEPGEKNVMQRPPYPPSESVFSRGVGRDIIVFGVLIGLAILGMAYFTEAAGWQWQTMTFATLAFSRIFLALAMRSERESIITKGVLTNRTMLAAVLLTFVLQLAVIYIPWLQTFLQTQSLSAAELLLSLNIATLGFWIVEGQKLLLRRTRRQHQ